MDSRITDERAARDPLLERLRERPFAGRRMPDERQLALIAASAGRSNRRAAWSARGRWIAWTGALMALVLLLAGAAYAYETPGGIADLRQSRAMGLNGTMHIPLGSSPEEAVEKFRQWGEMQVVHREAVDGGVLLFIKRNIQKDGTHLQIEFVRHTWLGWKWVMGGGYGIGYGGPASDVTLLNYMSMPYYKGIRGPFPIVFGELTDSSVSGVIVKAGGDSPGKYAAERVEYEPGKSLWFVRLPKDAAVPYTIQALDEKGDIAGENILDDARDMGEIKLRQSS